MPIIHTIGHSTHAIEKFVALLKGREIALLADVRSYPSSKRWPQFNQEALQGSVEQNGIAYRWLKALGGRRRSTGETVNDGWENAAFRAYADYAATAAGQHALGQLIEMAPSAPSVIMCSEGLWWRCHRRIIADYMTVRGWEVMHIMPDGKIAPHLTTAFAAADDGVITYKAVANSSPHPTSP